MARSEDLQRLIELLRRAPEERTPSDLSVIVSATEGVAFFKSQTQEVHRECCRVMTVVEFQKGEEICQYGDFGSDFYIILRGEVQVLAPKLHRKEPQTPPTPAISPSSCKPTGLVAVIPLPTPPSEVPDSPLLVPVAVISAGAPFGELALLYDQPRAATILALTYTVLIALSRTEFNRILKGSVGRRMTQKAEFLRSVDVFSRWRQQQLIKLSYHCREQFVCHRHTVYREGDSSDMVFLIVEGEFMFTKALAGKGGTQVKETEITIKGQREMFGDREVTEGTPRLCTSTCVSSSGFLYVISKVDFLRRVGSGELFRQLKQRHETEHEWLRDRIQKLCEFDPENQSPKAQITRNPPVSSSNKVLQFILAPINPLFTYRKTQKDAHFRTLRSIETKTKNLLSSQQVSKWRSVRLNDMALPTPAQNSYAISPMRRSRTPTNFLPKKSVSTRSHSRPTEPIIDAYEQRYEREAEMLADKYREKMVSSLHSAFRYTKRSNNELPSRPASRLSPAKNYFLSS